MKIINEFKGKYDFLSNFSKAKVEMDGVVFPSLEAAYQAAKFDKLGDRLRFRMMPANMAKKAGKQAKINPKKWDEKKYGIMLELVRDKFSRSPMKKKLLDTGDAELIEGNWWGDRYWGVCNGSGENNLGKILMQVRDEIRTLEREKKKSE